MLLRGLIDNMIASLTAPTITSSQDVEEPPSGIECEICCGENIPVQEISQCSQGHLFCKTCTRRMAEDRIGMRLADMPCMAMAVRRVSGKSWGRLNLFIDVQLHDCTTHTGLRGTI